MRITVAHCTSYSYSAPVSGLALRLRLFPCALPGQRVLDWRVTACASGIAPLLVNGFGDSEALWLAQRPVERVSVSAEGTVETGDAGGVIGRIGRAPPGVFLRRTPATMPDAAIRAFAEGVAPGAPLERLHALNAAVGDAIVYRPGATRAGASAAEAVALGAGVCQDQSHLFIAAARLLGHPARYVVGYLHDAETEHAETHAWAEAHVDGLGWVGFDPTHARSPTEAYIRLGTGLDAPDAAPLIGTYTGAAEESLAVTVRVAEAGAAQQ